MKLYNATAGKIENIKVIQDKGTHYVDKLTDQQLNDFGYYRLKYESMPNTRYYNAEPTSGIAGAEYVIGYTAVDKPLETVKATMLKDLKETFIKLAERPLVDTGLGYFVDGGRADLENFQIGKEFGFPAVKDVDGNMQAVTDADYDTIILAIKTKGVTLYQIKWAKEELINNFTTIAECIAYEAEPYDYTITAEDVLQDIGGTLVEGDIVTRYKNNVREW